MESYMARTRRVKINECCYLCVHQYEKVADGKRRHSCDLDEPDTGMNLICAIGRICDEFVPDADKTHLGAIDD